MTTPRSRAGAWPRCCAPAAGHTGARRGMRVEVLGPLAVWRDGRPLPLGPVRLRAVLGLPVLRAGTGVFRAALVDALWGQSPPPSATAMIQAQASQVRRLLSNGRTGPRLSWDGAGYRLSLAGIGLDMAEFGELDGQARRAAAGTAALAAARQLGDPAAQATVHRHAGHAQLSLGARAVAGQHLNEALSLLHRLGDNRAEARAPPSATGRRYGGAHG